MKLFVEAFIKFVSGLDYRFSWTKVNDIVLIVASICLLLGYFIYMKVIRENAYLSRVVEVQENQKVIDTGLYGLIRHPMYLATLLMFLAIPLVLGSYIGFMIMLIYPLAIVIRIKNEEEVLDKNLEGYLEYKEKVKYRLIPFIW
ncbi:MAG TPA: isoprenylcysteine carboxylmethyltransferase family protein [Bacteroidales bacterium]|jgi:protein-S-isoprenylcysteine O-methyltransferase Ste14|nr:isoprenylcysteine carboxylmethyltransferase family protein [Bacteroidales bacterium]HQA84685.1 isoprenylcysteine carboxylmethyltransferase family protein [Erysipelotrichaceae bacterium]